MNGNVRVVEYIPLRNAGVEHQTIISRAVVSNVRQVHSHIFMNEHLAINSSVYRVGTFIGVWLNAF